MEECLFIKEFKKCIGNAYTDTSLIFYLDFNLIMGLKDKNDLIKEELKILGNTINTIQENYINLHKNSSIEAWTHVYLNILKLAKKLNNMKVENK